VIAKHKTRVKSSFIRGQICLFHGTHALATTTFQRAACVADGLAQTRFFGTHVSVPKKPPKESNLAIVRKGLGLSQSDFARRLGVSASMIKKLEEGKRTMSQDLQGRIYAETGVLFVHDHNPDEPFTYTKEAHAEWSREIQFNEQSAVTAARVLSKLVELMLVAGARRGVQKSYQVFNAILQCLDRTKNEFQLEKHIEAELRDRHSTETKYYTVRELRDNDLLATMAGFKDDPNLKDDDTQLLTKTTGWLPSKELFNIWWQHRIFLREVLETQGSALNDEARAKLESMVEQMKKEMGSEFGALYKRSGLE